MGADLHFTTISLSFHLAENSIYYFTMSGEPPGLFCLSMMISKAHVQFLSCLAQPDPFPLPNMQNFELGGMISDEQKVS